MTWIPCVFGCIYTHPDQVKKGFKILCFIEFKCSVDKVVSRRVQFTIRLKYKGLSDHFAKNKKQKWTSFEKSTKLMF